MADRARYRDRAEAGHALARDLRHLVGRDPIVLGIPRGGVEVARAVADELDAPLDIVLVRKLPIPFAPETAFGVTSADGITVLDDALVEEVGLDRETIDRVEARVQGVLRRYAAEFQQVRPAIPIDGRVVILVDDGLATGYTMLGAVRICRRRSPAHIVAAAPVASDSAADLLREHVDELVCPLVDPGLLGVSAYFAEFPQVDDDRVRRLLSPEGRGAG